MYNSSTDLNISVSDDHIGLEDGEYADNEYYDNDNDTADGNATMADYCQEHIKIIRPYDPYTATVWWVDQSEHEILLL